MKETRTLLSNSSSLRAFQADAGVWAVLFELVTALQMFMRATVVTDNPTEINAARAKAKEVLKHFPDNEDLSHG